MAMSDETVEWFEIEGAGHEAFVAALRARAARWPRGARTPPVNTGGWVMEDGSLITYADVSDVEQHAIVDSFRVDFDGVRALAARVSPAHVQEGSLLSSDRPEGALPEEIAMGGPEECATAAAAWYARQLLGGR
jgi:hypothetical protein